MDFLQRGEVFPNDFCHLIDSVFGYIGARNEHIWRANRANVLGLIRVSARRKIVPVPQRVFGVEQVERLLCPIQYGEAVAEQSIGLGNRTHRRSGGYIHADDIAVLNSARGWAIAHIGEVKLALIVDAQRVEDEATSLFSARIALAKYIAFAIDIVEVHDFPSGRESGQ